MSRSLRDDVECRVWIHRHGVCLKTLTSFQQTWIQLAQGKHYILIIRLQGFQRNSSSSQKLYVLFSFNKQLLWSQLRPRKLSLQKVLKERNPERLWRLNVGLQFVRTDLSAEGATQVRTETPVVNKPCKMQSQQEGLVHILYLVPSSPQSMCLLSSIMILSLCCQFLPPSSYLWRLEPDFYYLHSAPVIPASLMTIKPLLQISLNVRLISSCLSSKQLTVSMLTKSACPFQ